MFNVFSLPSMIYHYIGMSRGRIPRFYLRFGPRKSRNLNFYLFIIVGLSSRYNVTAPSPEPKIVHRRISQSAKICLEVLLIIKLFVKRRCRHFVSALCPTKPSCLYVISQMMIFAIKVFEGTYGWC